jgi:hypothetical protein
MMLGEDWREAYIDFIWDQRLPAGMDARSTAAARIMRRSKDVLMRCVTGEDGYDIL